MGTHCKGYGDKQVTTNSNYAVLCTSVNHITVVLGNIQTETNLLINYSYDSEGGATLIEQSDKSALIS